MTDRRFNPSHPLVLGLAGEAGTGKTVTAHSLSPIASILLNEEGPPILWTHLYFALPLYQMARARKDIEGSNARDRMKYDIHSTLLEVFGANPLYGAPGYQELVRMVEEIASIPIEQDGKPRSFLQKVGTEICRAYDDNCWVKWMNRAITDGFRRHTAEQEAIEEALEEPGSYGEDEAADEARREPVYGVVIDDCRFVNEAEFIKNHPNGILLKLEVDPEVRIERLKKRDGVALTAEQSNHASELAIADIPHEWFTEVVDTTHMDVADQVAHIRKIVTTTMGLE